MRPWIVLSLCALLFCFTLGPQLWIRFSPESPVVTVEARLKAEEGFRALPYRDTRGVLTIGYGTNLDIGITKREGSFLLSERVEIAEVRLPHSWPPYDSMPLDVRVELLDMAYQLGVSGLLEFHEMLSALQTGNWSRAEQEALSSTWAEETPKRAARAASVFGQHK